MPNNYQRLRFAVYYASVFLVLCLFYAGQNVSNCESSHGCIGVSRIQEQELQQTRRRLEFVHIPKTGGTAIESIARNANLTWSICHFGTAEAVSKMTNGLVECFANATQTHSTTEDWQSGFFWEPYHCPWWHVPPAHVQAFYPEPTNPYGGADLFAVVRNPYERIISEYYYVINELENANEETMHDASHFNEVLYEQLSEFSSQMLPGNASQGTPGNNVYYSHDGHLIPQFDYVFDNGRRVVQHVLLFENLHADFFHLMAEYGLPLQLPTTRVRPKSEKKLGVSNLTLQNMLLIEDIYQDDFREFGYEVLSKRRLEESIPSQWQDLTNL